jgi:hypothetical protein
MAFSSSIQSSYFFQIRPIIYVGSRIGFTEVFFFFNGVPVVAGRLGTDLQEKQLLSGLAKHGFYVCNQETIPCFDWVLIIFF